MRRRRRNSNFITPTFNRGRYFVGGSLKKRSRRTFRGKGILGILKILDKIF